MTDIDLAEYAAISKQDRRQWIRACSLQMLDVCETSGHNKLGALCLIELDIVEALEDRLEECRALLNGVSEQADGVELWLVDNPEGAE